VVFELVALFLAKSRTDCSSSVYYLFDFRYRGVWSSSLPLRNKCRFLRSHVLPSLLYAAECGNHCQRDYREMAVFLNHCRRRLLKTKWQGGVLRRMRLDLLRRKCRLPPVLGLLAPRRLAFVARVLGRPSSQLARQMFFAKVAPGQGQGSTISGRARSSYLATLTTDMRYLYSGEVDRGSASLDYLVGLAGAAGGPCNVRQVLKELRPDETTGDSVVAVRSRKKVVCCVAVGCVAVFTERKELNRHVRTAHAGQGVDSADSGRFSCEVPGCTRAFKRRGWLERHVASVHTVV
jgi:uncharacterized C2H2 Zn-finger protein